MKKITIMLLLTAMLCGCGNSSPAESSVSDTLKDDKVQISETTAPPTEMEEEPACAWEYNPVYYYSNDEFAEASNKARTSENDKPLLLLKWDEDKYDIRFIEKDKSGYDYCMTDKVNEKSVLISVCSNTDVKEISEIHGIFGNKYSTITTAETGGKEYDIMVSSPEYGDVRNYSIIYIPMEGYYASIHTGNDTTQEEILEYFDDFQLVPESEA